MSDLTPELAETLSFTDIGSVILYKIASILPSNDFINKYSLNASFEATKSYWEEYTRTFYDGEDNYKYHYALEFLLLLVLIKLIITPREKIVSTIDNLSEREIDDIVNDFDPEPLVKSKTYSEQEDATYRKIPIFKGKHVAHSTYEDGKERLELGTFNFLGMVGNPTIEAAAIKSIRKYGVGSCGPRGFYGSIDVHQVLEQRLAEFLGTEEAILYSYGFATIASAIPAYSKRGDIIYCDKGVGFATQKGISASRSTVRWFDHNDMSDLERCMKEQAEEDLLEPSKASKQRRLIVVEGLYINNGDICPLDEVLELKYKYKARLFVEESGSFGVLGKTGRGITEHFGIKVSEIDQICASLENATGSVGGFCAGSSFVIDHQRLGGSGYVFSASLPPLLASASLVALDIMNKNEQMFTELAGKATLMHELLRSSVRGMVVNGDTISPIIHLRLQSNTLPAAEQDLELQRIIAELWNMDIVVTRAKYIADKEFSMPQPSIRIAVTLEHTDEDIHRAAKAIADTCVKVFSLDD
eukprot:CFRG7167T1